jgi:hypothetical protein
MYSAAIESTDSRYAERFTRFPLRHVYRDLFGMIPAQIRTATGEIRIPDEASDGDYDLVLIGSPTWWLRTSVPVRSYLKSAAGRILTGKHFAVLVVCRRYWGFNLKTVEQLGTAKGGTHVDGAHWSVAGGQVQSLLSLSSYLGQGENRERYLGVKVPVTNLQAGDLGGARTFASELADRLVAGTTERVSAAGRGHGVGDERHSERGFAWVMRRLIAPAITGES